MHIYVSVLLTQHAEAWKEFGETKIIETVHFFDYSLLMEIRLNPKDEILIANGITYHMKIEKADPFHDIIWLWE